MAGDVFSLTDNPFAQIGLTPRASREQIEERAGRAHHIAQLLLDPFRRLAEELSWLPGASGQAAQDTVQALAARNAVAVSERLLLLRGLAKANLAADAAGRFGDLDMIEQMVRAWDAVEVDDVTNQVNADRMISGFPQVNPAQVGWALQAVRERHGASAAQLMATAGDGRDRLVRLIERPAPSGQDTDLRLIDALVSAWAEVAGPSLDQKESALLAEVDAMTRGGRDGIDRLEMLLADWQKTNWPALLLASRRGREDARTLALVGEMRTLYLDPAAGAGRLGPASRIAALIAQFFPNAPAIQRMTASDLARLGDQPIGPQGIAERPTATAVAATAARERTESKSDRARRHAGVKARDAARANANAEEARRRLAEQQRARAATDWNQPKARQVPAPGATVISAGNAAEAAREALIAQVRARVQAQGQAPAGAKKKKAGCGWIIPLLIGGGLLVRCINEIDDEPRPPTPPTISAPTVITPPEAFGDPPMEPATPQDPRRRGSSRRVDNQVGSGAPDGAPPPDEDAEGGGSPR